MPKRPNLRLLVPMLLGVAPLFVAGNLWAQQGKAVTTAKHATAAPTAFPATWKNEGSYPIVITLSAPGDRSYTAAEQAVDKDGYIRVETTQDAAPGKQSVYLLNPAQKFETGTKSVNELIIPAHDQRYVTVCGDLTPSQAFHQCLTINKVGGSQATEVPIVFEKATHTKKAIKGSYVAKNGDTSKVKYYKSIVGFDYEGGYTQKSFDLTINYPN